MEDTTLKHTPLTNSLDTDIAIGMSSLLRLHQLALYDNNTLKQAESELKTDDEVTTLADVRSELNKAKKMIRSKFSAGTKIKALLWPK